jgi:hypothetical protein
VGLGGGRTGFEPAWGQDECPILSVPLATDAITAPFDASEASQPLPPATTPQQGKQHNHHTHQEVSVQLAAEHPAATVLGDKAGQRGAVTTTRSPLALKAAVRRVIRKLLAQT